MNNRHASTRDREIDYGIASTPLGRVLVAGTARGVAAVYLGDADGALKKELRREYPLARLRHNPAGVGRWMRRVTERLAGKRQVPVPLDVEGTEFERRVWRELEKIPYGTLCSYSDVSRRLGRPSAVRAVASAIGRNPVSILVPCHRVVRQNGELGGYRWGIKRKQALLEREREGARLA